MHMNVAESQRTRFFEVLVQETMDDRQALLSVPIVQRALAGDVSIDEYVAFLCQAYHHVRQTVPLLMAVGARLSPDREWLRVAVAGYIEEELGHQEWVLRDIAQCGYDVGQVPHMKPHLHTELMVAYAWDTIQRVNPLGFFGMVHVLEGTSVALADQAADGIARSTGLPQEAFSYLRSHGALDQEHVKFFEDLMNRIDDADEQALIIHCCRRFYHLYGQLFRNLHPAHGLVLLKGLA